MTRASSPRRPRAGAARSRGNSHGRRLSGHSGEGGRQPDPTRLEDGNRASHTVTQHQAGTRMPAGWGGYRTWVPGAAGAGPVKPVMKSSYCLALSVSAGPGAGTESCPQHRAAEQVRAGLPLLPSRQPAPGHPGSPAVPGEREEGAERVLRGCPAPPTHVQLQPRSLLCWQLLPPAHGHPSADSRGAAESPKPLSVVQSLSRSFKSPLRKLSSPSALLLFPRDCSQGSGKGQGPSHHQVTSFIA